MRSLLTSEVMNLSEPFSFSHFAECPLPCTYCSADIPCNVQCKTKLETQFQELELTQVVEDFLGLFGKLVERISLFQICTQRLRSGLTFTSMRQCSHSPCSIFIFEYRFVWDLTWSRTHEEKQLRVCIACEATVSPILGGTSRR